MAITVIGLNHDTAPVEVREKVAITEAELGESLSQSQAFASESMIVSTCNRTEIYYCTDDDGNSQAQCLQWLAAKGGIAEDQLHQYLYILEQQDAVEHILKVACGLDSLVLGEPQILGQIKTALKSASDHNAVSKVLHRVMQHAFKSAKRVRTKTSIGSNPVSVAYAAVALAKHIYSDLSQQTVLLIGAGETIELVGKHLHTHDVKQMVIANRSLANAERIASEYNGTAITLDQLDSYLPDADIVISSTAAPVAIVGKGAVERALQARRHKPIFMVDIAVPRDIEPEVAELNDVYLYTVDDLQSVIEDNKKSRADAAKQAEAMIAKDAKAIMEWLQAQGKIDTLIRYREQIEAYKQEALEKALQKLDNDNPQAALEYLAHSLTNKLAHEPTQAMSQAAHQGEIDLLLAAERLFKLHAEDE